MRCRLRGLPLAYGILAARTQDEIPDAADQVFVSALANGKVYIAYGSIRPKVQIAACSAIRAGYNKRAEPGAKTPSSAASPSVPRSNHHSLKRQNRPRRCWRWLWDCNEKARELAYGHDGHSAAGVTAAISGFLSPPNVVSWILPSTIWMRRSARAASAASWVTTTTVWPPSAMSRRIPNTCAVEAVSRFPVGSSATLISGRLASARASATRCR